MKKLACFALVNLTFGLPTFASSDTDIPSVLKLFEGVRVIKASNMVEPARVVDIPEAFNTADAIKALALIAPAKVINIPEAVKTDEVAQVLETAIEPAKTAEVAQVLETAIEPAKTAEVVQVLETAIEPAKTAEVVQAIKTDEVIKAVEMIKATEIAKPVKIVGKALEENKTDKLTEALETEKNNVANTLNIFHAAAAKANWASYFEQMSDDSVFIGTDASERWEKAAFQAYTAKRKEGWIYTLRQRNINFTPDRRTAWFDEILDSKNYGTSRGSGVLVATGNGWKIAQYHLTFPIPNDLVQKVTTDVKNFEQSNKTLDTFHQAASEANWKTYFEQMSDDAVFLGTDVSERWEKAAFQTYANTRHEGWAYKPKQRNIRFTADGLAAWFDEILDSQKYGTSRGTGLLINTKEGWKISKYQLAFPIPNGLAVKVTKDIKKFEDSQKQAKN